MRTVIAYTSARILIFGIAVLLLHMVGAGGVLMFVLALVISALASYILLNKQREVLAGKLNGRLGKVGGKVGGKVTEFRERLEDGAALEDSAAVEDDEPENVR
jgi:hypothetical protein